MVMTDINTADATSGGSPSPKPPTLAFPLASGAPQPLSVLHSSSNMQRDDDQQIQGKLHMTSCHLATLEKGLEPTSIVQLERHELGFRV